MNKRLIIILAAGALFVVILVGLSLGRTFSGGTIKLTVVPKDATVLIDDRDKASPGTIRLSAGQHSLKVSRDGFEAQTITVTVVANQSRDESVVLAPSDETGQAYLDDNPDQVAQAEGIASARGAVEAKEIEEANPLIKILPYHGSTFDIDYGLSRKNADKPNAVAIYITVDDDASKAKALGWIKAQGYDPADYEIIYESSRQEGE